ncbi:PAS domain S-box protein [Mucilaginibacter psychrotolerans]|uniref:Sensory/regulatory protein RpfC n=1 Tax=Mucilaginibacter psychrotolerans TaxID=1524096 RepID=A0A4Y8S731_9SPHI|nr:PAS domain S-box protein [Mucilaginibacter psychrotolerans]TFF34732.1 PAS domain S-box protein [Mucilaginibacter psychrotolerans]
MLYKVIFADEPDQNIDAMENINSKLRDLALLTSQNPDPLFCISIHGYVLTCNPAAEELVCVTFESKNYSIADFWVHFAKKGDYIFDHFTFEITSGFKVYSFICRYLPEQNYFNAYGRDITQVKRNEDELVRLSLVASANENGVLFNDATGRILWANESFCKLVGYKANEVVGKNALDFCKGAISDEETLSEVKKDIGVCKSFNRELLHYRKDGSCFWARVRGQSYKTNSQEVHYFSVVEDITREKDREGQLKVLSQIAENNINAVIITDNSGSINWVNRSFTNMTGYTSAEAIGKKPGHLLQGPATDRKTIAYLKNQIQKGLPFNTEIYNYHKTGHGYWLRIQGQPITSDNGELIGFFAIEENITREKEIQTRIKESEDRFKLALEKIGDNVWEHNFDTGKTHFYKANDDLWGCDTHKPVDGMNWWASVHQDDLPRLTENYQQYQAGSIYVHNLEYRIRHADGSIKWILDKGVVLERKANGLPLKTIGTHTDITTIKQTEKELEQRMKRFKALSENIPGVIYEYEFRKDGTEGLSYISPAMERVFGIAPEHFGSYLEYIHPDDLEIIRQKNEHSRLTLAPFYIEAQLFIPGQPPRWHAVDSSFSYISQDGATVFTGFMKDITERKVIEGSLRVNEEKYRNIIANMNLGLLEVDNDGCVTYANQSFCDMSGYTVNELIGADAGKVFLTPDQYAILEEKQQRREEGISDAYELEVTNKAGEKRWWLLSGAPRYNDKRELVGSIGIHLDITNQKLQETELVAARIKAERLAKAKDAFLANMSHEIRTPMNAIMGMSNQLAKTKLEPQQHFYLNTILSASDNLLVIINDILDLSKIEAGKLTFENIGFDITRLIENVKQVITHKAEEKGLQLRTGDIDSEIGPVLIGDPYRINQVLLNLMSNAVKFTDSGSVSLSCKLLKNNADSQLIEISVMDTGVGMEESFIARLFEKFSQEYESVTRQYGGTGLGMSICKELIELMKGQINVVSKKGEGTTVSVALELIKGSVSDLPEKTVVHFAPDFLRKKKVLVTDDNDLNRLIASIILQNHGATVLTAENGMVALKIIEDEQPDIILMDVQMPILNGFETTKQLRQSNISIPVIALTAAAIKGEREKCIAAGMNDYITKPFKEEEFLKIINKWLSVSQEAETPAEPLYNLSRIKEISRGNEVFVERMVDIFCTQTPGLVADMDIAYRENDLARMASIAHQLKPSVENLEIKLLQHVIKTIEDIGKQKQDDTGLDKLLKEARELTETVVKLMKQEYPD